MAGVSQDVRNGQVKTVLKGLEDLGAVVFFEKPLTSSDTSGSGRVVIPKAIAEQYFPRLEQPNGIPVTAVDTKGRQYTFKYRFWVNNQSRMYLMEGAGELHRAFDMSVGDVMVFAQKPDGALVVAGRPATKNDVIKKAPLKRATTKAEAPSGRRDAKPKRPAGGDARSAGAGQGAGDKARKRSKTGPYSSALQETEPAADGIFRAVPGGLGDQPGGVSASKSGRWVVSLNMAGELYQAFFDTQEDAQEAYNATGSTPTVPASA